MKLAISIVFFLLPSGALLANNLIPPDESTRDDRVALMTGCLSYAKRIANDGGESLPGLDKELIRGRPTSHFLSHASLTGPKLVAEKDDGALTGAKSLFSSARSTKVTDPYVVCLLLSGYRWEDINETGLEQVERLANEGNIRAQAELGAMYYYARYVGTARYTKSVELLQSAAEGNDPAAQFQLAIAYAEGNGVLPNDRTALMWMERSASGGHEQAETLISELKRRIARAESQAKTTDIHETESDANAGNKFSQLNMGVYHERGVGVEQDIQKALSWYRKAADQGYARAQTYIGIIYDKGRGVPQDLEEAAKWYELAAKGGDAQGQYNFALALYYGTGIAKDQSQAKVWMEKAASQNHPNAAKVLRERW